MKWTNSLGYNKRTLGEKIADFILGLVVFIGVGAVLIAIASYPKIVREQEAFKDQCEWQGGVVLDRTYVMGKTTGHKYTCIKKDVILQ